MTKTIVLGAFVAGLASPMGAQTTGIIAGYVTAYGTNVPVSNASVRLVTGDVLVSTDAEGYFALRAVPPGRHTLVIQALGYQPTMKQATEVLAATLTNVHVVLRPTTYQLAPVEVEVEAAETKNTQAVTVMTGRELPPEGDIVLGLAGRVPGLTLTFPSGAIRSGGRTDAASMMGRNGKPMMWVLDGVAYPGQVSFRVDASEVDCIEVRHGGPSTYQFLRAGQRANNFGGAIIIWTTTGTRRRFGACS